MATPPPSDNLTERILREADASAERLLGLVRMGVAATLAAAMLLAIHAPGRPDLDVLDQQIMLASAVLAAYFGIGLASYGLVRLEAYRPWMAWLTATMDVAVLTANLWLNLKFSGVSSLFLFAFPGALMPALILTFGALRYRPHIQLYVVAVTGAALAALLLSSMQGPVTAEMPIGYLAIPFGLPPSAIRIVMITAVGAVVAISVWRARALLYRIARESEQRLNLTRFLPRGVAEDMSDAQLARLRAGRRATLAIMFVDIRGFTNLAERTTPEETARILGRYREIVSDEVERGQGIVDKFIGDGALAIFGLEGTPAEAARSAIETGEALLARIAQWDLGGEGPIRAGVGIHLGEVTVGVVGEERRLEFTVIGDPVNVAARIETMTKTTGHAMLASADVIEAAGAPRREWRDLGDAEVRGRAGGVRLWGYGNAMQGNDYC